MGLAAEVFDRVCRGQVLNRLGDWVNIDDALTEQTETYNHLCQGEVETDTGWVPLSSPAVLSESPDTATQISADPAPFIVTATPAATENSDQNFERTTPNPIRPASRATVQWRPLPDVSIGLDVTAQQSNDTPPCVVIAVKTLIDQSTAPRLRTLLTDILALAPCGCIVDLAETTYISSAGWGVLAATNRLFANSASELVLCSVPSQAAESLTLLQLDKILHVFDSLDTARIHLLKELNQSSNGSAPRATVTQPDPVSVPDSIRNILADYGPVSMGQILHLLQQPPYGAVRISRFKLFGLLKTMNLDSRSKQERFYRSC